LYTFFWFSPIFWAWPTLHANGPGWPTDLDINLSHGEAKPPDQRASCGKGDWHLGIAIAIAIEIGDPLWGLKPFPTPFATQMQLCPRARNTAQSIRPTKNALGKLSW